MIYFRTLLIIMFIQGITKHSRDDPPHCGDSADDASPLPGFDAINTGSDDPPAIDAATTPGTAKAQPTRRIADGETRRPRALT